MTMHSIRGYRPGLLQNRGRGATLVELVIAMAINLIVALGAFAVFVAASKMQQDIFQHNLIDGEARKVEDRLVSDIRSAITLESSFTHSGTTYNQSTSTLILRLPAVTATGDPVDMQPTPTDTASDFIVYYHDGNNYMRRLLVRHADSFRDGSNAASEDILLGRSANPGVAYTSAFAAAPDILGPIVVHYEFRSSRYDPRRGNAPNPYLVAAAGSVYLRNRPEAP